MHRQSINLCHTASRGEDIDSGYFLISEMYHGARVGPCLLPRAIVFLLNENSSHE